MNKTSKKKKKKSKEKSMTDIKNFQRKNATYLKSFTLNYPTSSESYRSYRFKDQEHSKIELISWNQYIFLTSNCL